MVAITNTFTNRTMMDNNNKGDNDDDDEAKRIKVVLRIANEKFDRDGAGEDTIHIETELVVETITDAIVMADSGIVIEEDESTKDIIFAREEFIVSLNYKYGMYHFQKTHQIKIWLTIWCK